MRHLIELATHNLHEKLGLICLYGHTRSDGPNVIIMPECDFSYSIGQQLLGKLP